MSFPLNEWPGNLDMKKQKEDFADKNSLVTGIQHILTLNPSLFWLED